MHSNPIPDSAGSAVPEALTQCVLAFGANLGDRATTIKNAAAELQKNASIHDLRLSPLVESVAVKPDGLDDAAPKYLNAVALLDTSLSAREILQLAQAIEAQHGRERAEKWGDRTLDIDIIAYGDAELREADLVIPHPHVHLRDFVLAPWLMLDPDATLPGRGKAADLLAITGNATQIYREGEDA